MRIGIYLSVLLLVASIVSCAADRELMKEQANLHYRTALSYMMQGDNTTALRELMIGAEKDPENQAIQSALGLISVSYTHLTLLQQGDVQGSDIPLQEGDRN